MVTDMSYRYWTSRSSTGQAWIVARADESTRPTTIERITVDAPTWVLMPSLFKNLYGEDNLDWWPVDEAGAEAFAGEMGIKL